MRFMVVGCFRVMSAASRPSFLAAFYFIVCRADGGVDTAVALSRDASLRLDIDDDDIATACAKAFCARRERGARAMARRGVAAQEVAMLKMRRLTVGKDMMIFKSCRAAADDTFEVISGHYGASLPI